MDSFKSKICITIAAKSIGDAVSVAKKYAAYADIAELRVDALDAPDADEISSFPSQTGLETILTIRRKRDGGINDLSEDERKSLFRALPSFGHVDFEEDFDDAFLLSLAQKNKVRIIRSRHVFSPCGISALGDIDKIARSAHEIPKLAFMPEGAKSLASLFRVCRSLPKRDRIICAMGPEGVASRILSSLLRSYLTFTSPAELIGKTPSLGHIDPIALNETYSFNAISPSTILTGVTGWPLKVTGSPQIHRSFYEGDGLDAVMVPLPSRDIKETMEFCSETGFRGLAVTVPHKETVMPLLDRIDPVARKIGAVNTVLFRGGEKIGFNTDAPALSDVLKRLAKAESLHGRRAAIIGAGGAAKAAAYALCSLGAEAAVYARNPAKAKEVADPYGFGHAPIDDFTQERNAQIIVQATSLGLGSENTLDDPIANYAFRGDELLYEMIYKPETTPVMKRAREAGATAENGLSMLYGQARLQHKIFFRKKGE